MNEEIQALLELTKSLPTDVAQKFETLTKSLDTSKAEAKAEVETLKAQLAEVIEKQLNIETKGILNMSAETQTKALDLNAVLVKGIREAGQGEDVITKGVNGMSTTDTDSAGVTVRNYQGEMVRPLFTQSNAVGLFPAMNVKNEKFTRLVAVGDYGFGWGTEDYENKTSRGNTSVGGFKEVKGAYGELWANPFVTNRVIHDSEIDILGEVQRGVQSAFARAIPHAILKGDGVNKPKGLFTYRDEVESLKADGERRHDVAQHFIADAKKFMVDAKYTFDFLQGVIDGTNVGYLAGAKFLMNQSTYSRLLGLADAQGHSFLREKMAVDGDKTLLGFGVVVDPAVDSTGVVISFGDHGAAMTMLNVEGLSVIADPYKVKGNIELFHSMRFGTIQGDLQAVKFVVLK